MSNASESPTVARFNARVVLITVGAALGGFLFGFDTSVINGAVDSINKHFDISNTGLQGFAVSSALLGCAIGAWFAGGIANRLGRIPVMVIAAILFLVSSVLTGLAPNVPLFIIWRVLGGLGVGAASVIAPAYIAEVSPARVRGRLGSLQQLAIVLGIFVALLSDNVLANAAGGASETLWWGLEAWRWMFFVTAIPAAVYGIAALGLPESPRFLVHRGDYDRASRILHDFSGELDVNLKIQEIEKTIDKEKKESLRDLRGNRLGLKPVVWVGILLSVFQQFVGINVIFYYSSSLWQSVGFDESDALLESVITSITNIVVTVVAILLVDKVGRRPMLLVGSAWARCSPTRSARPRWRWPRPPSGSPTSSSRRRSRSSPRSASRSRTGSTRSSRSCRSSSCSGRSRRPRAASSRTCRTMRSWYGGAARRRSSRAPPDGWSVRRR
jgi:sugar porter (SP) family MFS transporter